MKSIGRRRFLRGVGGVTVGLPMLDVFRDHESKAAGRRVFSVFMLQANGVVQPWGSEPMDMFWPRTYGPLSDATMMGPDADRATSELAGWASKLLMVRNINLAFPGNGCGHSGGCNQVLTAAKVSVTPSGAKSLPMGESLDNRIARELTPGKEPLALYAGPKYGYLDDAFSYRKPNTATEPAGVRAAENIPWNAYQRLIGLNAGTTDPATLQLIATRRKSVNDLIRAQMQSLLARKDLSGADRARLDLHFSSVRDLELSMIKTIDTPTAASMMSLSTKTAATANDAAEKVTNLQLDLIAFALAADMTRTATLQVGSGNSGIQYTVGGVKYPSYHQISHRIFSDGATGAPITDALKMHHQIDRIHARHFKHLLEKLAAYSLPEGGTLLDSTVAVWCNSLSNGPPHGRNGVPYIIAGSGGGYLKQGQMIDGKANNNKLFNTLLNAVGVRKADGSLIDDFGDPSLVKGQLTQLLA